MKIIILGAGQVGRTAAYHLAREEANDVTVVDLDESLLRDLQDRIDIRTVQGNAASPRTLETAGARDADMIVALTNSDETNMVACHVAWSLFGTRTKIARIRSRDYTRNAKLFVSTEDASSHDVDGLSKPVATGGALGFAVDMYLSPEESVTAYVERLIRYPGALQIVDFAENRVRLVGLKALKGGALVGRPIRELRTHMRNSEARVAAMYRKGESIEPEGDTEILDGDEVFFVAATQDIRVVMKEMQKLEDPVKRVVIAGGGNIGFRLAQTLEEENQVKVIERDSRRARRISEQLRNSIVLVGDAADEELLVEENIDSVDVFCALTNSEEANILSAMLAKRLGARRVMALISRPAYADLTQIGSIDVAISPQTVTIGSLLAYVRRGDVVQVHSLRRGSAEAMETIAHGLRGGKVVGRPIGDIRLPEGAKIVTLVRGEQVIMAHHDTVIENGDHVILFLSDKRHVEQVERLFQT
ncbi:MAG TPA: Trk system potassium transporter TrkA [Steroidobacteraceae bacterium]|nr:Trk system potassium transporter TrkA [Steroidobacteraceae bacterium]